MEPLCRLCLQGGSALRPLEDAGHKDNSNIEEPNDPSLVQLVLKYLSIQIIKVECTESPFICISCQTLIEEWHQFHNACHKNDEIYQQRLAEENQVRQSVSTVLKQEEIDNQDTAFEPQDDDRDAQNFADADDATSGHNTSEDEEDMDDKIPSTNRKEKSDSKVKPRKRGRPKLKEKEINDRLEDSIRSRKRAEVCTICGKFIKNMTEHMRIHNNERRHQCPYCPKAFVSASNYYSHVNIHTRAKMFKCDLCDKQYSILNSLKQHRVTHFKERIYLCPVCGKAYYQPTGLARHKRTHFEEPKIKCSECDKMFLTNSDLRKHFTKHLPEKPFKCEICRRAFSRKDNLRTHMNTHSKAAKTLPPDSNPNVPEPNITIKRESPNR